MGCLSLGLTFLGAGIVYIQKLCTHIDYKIKHHKIMFSFKEYRKKREKKNKKNKNIKVKDNEKKEIVEDNKQTNNLIEEEIFENKSFDGKI